MKVKLHKKLYSKSGVTSAIKAFENLAKMKLESVDKHYIVSISDIDSDMRDSIADEFCNYCLHGSIAGKKSW